MSSVIYKTPDKRQAILPFLSGVFFECKSNKKRENSSLSKGMSSKVIIQEFDIPVGEILLGALGNQLCLCDWKCNKHRSQNDNRIKRLLGVGYESITPIYNKVVDSSFNKVRDSSFLTIQRASQELREYVSGERKSFDVPLLMVGTDFQKRVWQALMSIPYGSIVSYMDIARRIGNPKSVRAVAQAIGSNPISILVPCHRVVGCNGRLTGYAGGVEAKRFLLQLEDSTRLV